MEKYCKIQSQDIHRKFIRYLKSAKDLAVTGILLDNIADTLSIKSSDNNRIIAIVINDSSKDDYEYAYNYLDKEFNVFKHAKKDINTRVTANYASGKSSTPDKITSWVKTGSEILKFITVAAGILGISLVLRKTTDPTDATSAAK